MKYIVYLTINLKSKINGLNRIYVGVHKTEHPEIFDGYIGCGIKTYQPSTYMYPKSPLQYAVKKFGVDAFYRVTLYVYDNEKDAYQKEYDIVTEDFIKQPHVYNISLGGIYEERYKPLYQYDLKGNLIKKWERSMDAYEFYGYPAERFQGPKRNKCAFLNSFWSTSPITDITEYSDKSIQKITYLYDKDSKLINIFDSLTECCKEINCSTGDVCHAIKEERLIKGKYYVSYKMVDEFKPKPRRQYMNKTYYVYKENGEFVAKCYGKELMKVINLHSWEYINHIFFYNKQWYKDFYISLQEITEVPPKHIGNGMCIDVYTKYGDYIETIKSVKEVRQKYKVPASKIRNIQQGDRYFGDYIFRYNSK